MHLPNEVYEPLGRKLGPSSSVVPAGRLDRFSVFATIPLLLAVAAGAFAFGNHGAATRDQPLAARIDPSPAPARTENASAPSSKVDAAVQSPVGSTDEAERVGGIRISRSGDAGAAPTSLIINVQQALAAQKAAASTAAQR